MWRIKKLVTISIDMYANSVNERARETKRRRHPGCETCHLLVAYCCFVFSVAGTHNTLSSCPLFIADLFRIIIIISLTHCESKEREREWYCDAFYMCTCTHTHTCLNALFGIDSRTRWGRVAWPRRELTHTHTHVYGAFLHRAWSCLITSQ